MLQAPTKESQQKIMASLRSCQIFKTFYPDTFGGVENVIYQVSKQLQHYDVDNSVLTLSPSPTPPRINWHGIDVKRFHENFNLASTGFSVPFLKAYKETIATCDIINYHFPWPFADIAHFIHRPSIPFVVTYHSDIIKQKNLLHLYKPLMHWFLKKSQKIIVASPCYAETSPILRHYRDKIDVIPIGLDPVTYPAPTPQQQSQWCNKIGTDFFLFIGVFRYYKGLHFLFQALKGTTIKLVLVGDGPEKENLLQLAQDLGIQSQIHFVGKVSDEDKVALLSLAKAIVLPSHLRSEAFGISLLEGAMCKKPLISCEIGTGTTYINIHQETGLVVPPACPESLHTAIAALDQNPDLCHHYGENAFKRFQTLFTAKEMGKAYYEIYQKTICRTC